MEKEFKVEYIAKPEIDEHDEHGSTQKHSVVESLSAGDSRQKNLNDADVLRKNIALKLIELRNRSRQTKEESTLIQQFLATIPEFEILLDNLDSANYEKVPSLVQQLRDKFCRETEVPYHNPMIIRTEEALNKLSQNFRKDKDKGELLDYKTDINKVGFNVLYHFAPRALREKILAQGILPGFLSGESDRTFVFMSPVADTRLPSEHLEHSRRVTDTNLEFDLYEINVDQLPECFMQFVYKGFDEKKKETFSVLQEDTLLSSKVVPIESQLQAQKDEGFDTDIIYSWENSEFLADYVPPDALFLLNP